MNAVAVCRTCPHLALDHCAHGCMRCGCTVASAPDRPICTCASAYGEFIGCKVHGIEADSTNRPIGAKEED